MLNELLNLKTPNNAWEKNVHNTTKWLVIHLANKTCQKYAWQKVMYSEICKMLSFDNLIVNLVEKSNLTYYTKRKNLQ
jgi:peptidyl-tRNA hydrolase